MAQIKEIFQGLIGQLLVSERTNTQRCIAKDLDTTKTIIDTKNTHTHFNMTKRD